MKHNRKFEKIQIKWFIKSSIFYYSFLTIFIAIFLYISVSLKLDVRQSYDAIITDKEITMQTELEILPLDEKVYIYINRNERTVLGTIVKTYYSNGRMHFILKEVPTNLSGEITIELTINKQSLISRIFAKGGRN